LAKLADVWWAFWHKMAGGCSTLVVVEEIYPFNVKRFEFTAKHYINVTNYN